LGAFTYPRSEPGSAGHQDLVERLNAHAATLRHEVANLSEPLLTQRVGDDWSIKDVVGHLCDWSHLVHKRLHMMINLEDPRLAGLDQEELAKVRNANATPIGDLLKEYAAQRAETVDMLADLVHWNWARPGRHPHAGRISIRQQVEMWLDHEDEHFAQIRALKSE